MMQTASNPQQRTISPEISTIIEEIKGSSLERVKVAITDIDGILRGKVIHLDKFLSAAQSGFGFCDVVLGWDCQDKCYENSDHTGWHTGYPDAHTVLDFKTYRKIPWEENSPFFLADLEDGHGNLLEVAPRSLLKQVRKRALGMDLLPIFSEELEWFNFQETSEALYEKGFQQLRPMTQGMFGYSVLRASQKSSFFYDLFELLKEFGVPLEGLHTETGPGVYEAAIICDDVLEAADRAVLFKTAVKEIGHLHGVLPSFMAKWNKEYAGCSGHLHQSLWDLSEKRNLFYDADAKNGMTELMESYVAGQLHCLPKILPMFAPTVNSFKRLVKGHWAPTSASWGIDNRTSALRILNTGSKSTRIEHRVCGSDANPYLAMAASLASGLYGIQHNLKLDMPPDVGSAYEQTDRPVLPRDLAAATEAMKRSELSCELFGEAFTKHFIQTREWEWQESMQAVTDWELKRYFEII